MKPFLFLLMFPLMCFSQEDSSAFSFHGNVEAYYSFSLNDPATREIQYSYNFNRHNQFAVNHAMIGTRYADKKTRANILLHAGTYVQSNYSAEPAILQHLYEANAGVKIGKRFWLDAGILPSHIGIEGVVARDNWTLTRSMSAEGYVYYQTGARLSYIGKKIYLAAFVLNGWQTITDANNDKPVGTQFQYRPNDKILFNWSSFYGEPYNASDTSALIKRLFNDVYLTYDVNKKISVCILADYGIQNNFSWHAETVFVKYKVSDKHVLCFRQEFYNDPNACVFNTGLPSGYRTSGQSLNFDYMPTSRSLLRIECKYISSKDQIFLVGSSKLSSNNTIFTGSISTSF